MTKLKFIIKINKKNKYILKKTNYKYLYSLYLGNFIFIFLKLGFNFSKQSLLIFLFYLKNILNKN